MNPTYRLINNYPPRFTKGTEYEKVAQETFLGRTTHELKCLRDGNYRIRVTDKELSEEFELVL